MHTIIELQVSEELAQRLAPYQNQLPELLEAGLRVWQDEEHATNEATLQERIRRVLAASGRVRLPKADLGMKPYTRHTPVPITGKPVSEIVIEQRGPH
jgi:hypothetical protein